jgi:hypothetical protein
MYWIIEIGEVNKKSIPILNQDTLRSFLILRARGKDSPSPPLLEVDPSIRSFIYTTSKKAIL